MRGLEATALIDSDIHQYRTPFHPPDHVAGYQLGRLGAGHQHPTDHQIRLQDIIFESSLGGVHGLERRAEAPRQPRQHLHVAIQHGHVGGHAQRHVNGVFADHAAADHHHLGRGHAGDTAQQDAAPALGAFQRRRAGLNRQPAGHLRHRRQQR